MKFKICLLTVLLACAAVVFRALAGDGEPRPGLRLYCSTPDQIILGHPFGVVLYLRNTGNQPQTQIVATLSLPADAPLSTVTDSGVVAGNVVTWNISNLPTGAVKQVCAVFKTRKIGMLNFDASVRSAEIPRFESSGKTEVIGLPDLVIDRVQNTNPVAAGSVVTYTVKITNQGTGAAHNVQLVAIIAPQLTPAGGAEGKIDGQTVTLPVIPRLGPQEVVTYRINAKGVTAGMGISQFKVMSDASVVPLVSVEKTTVYSN